MTECERIIKDGVLPESFFKSETICDFYVDEKRKKTWAVCIDLLLCLDKICKRHNIKYFISYGSLIGAIRHHSFIPWDDDIDVCMLREDYDKLLSLPPDEFTYPYILQAPGKDHDYYFSFSKLRNSNTSGISESFRYANFNQGMYLDIFPLDHCELDTAESNFYKIKLLIEELSANMRRSNKYPSKNDLIKIQKYKERDCKEIYDELDQIARNSDCHCGDLYINAVSVISNYDKLLVNYNDIKDLININLWGYDFPIPSGYDNILRTTYGDYLQLPPVEMRGNWHSTSIFDPDTPYKQKLKEIHLQDKENHMCHI